MSTTERKMDKTTENILQTKGLTFIQFEKNNIVYVCNCGETVTKTLKTFKRNEGACRICNERRCNEVPTEPEHTDEKTGEIWKPIKGGFISNLGNAKNGHHKRLNLCPTKYRYHIGGENKYASRLVAMTFQIKDYELLGNQSYVVSHRDSNPANNKVENLYVRTKVDIGSENGTLSHQSENFREKLKWDVNKFIDIKAKIVPELPNHLIHSNGQILNINIGRFLTFTKICDQAKDQTNTYYCVIIEDVLYRVHRLVCYAFNPLPDMKTLDDYKHLQVNHKDGNKTNNSADNLEWVNSSENQNHAYQTGLKRGQAVIQYNQSGERMNEYASIAEASRKTGDAEHTIRSGAKGKPSSKAKYIWKFVNEDYAEECSKKYTKM